MAAIRTLTEEDGRDRLVVEPEIVGVGGGALLAEGIWGRAASRLGGVSSPGLADSAFLHLVGADFQAPHHEV